MPKLSKCLPKYRKHRASGQAVVTLDGRDYDLGPHGSRASKAEYDRLTGEWLANGRRMPATAQTAQITVVELIEAFWRHAKDHYRKDGRNTSELDNYRTVLRDLRRLYGTILAADFTPSKLKSVRQTWLDRGLNPQRPRATDQTVTRIRADARAARRRRGRHDSRPTAHWVPAG